MQQSQIASRLVSTASTIPYAQDDRLNDDLGDWKFELELGFCLPRGEGAAVSIMDSDSGDDLVKFAQDRHPLVSYTLFFL